MPEKEDFQQDVKEWLIVSVICIVMLMIGFVLAKMVVQSEPMQTRKKITKLSEENTKILNMTVDHLIKAKKFNEADAIVMGEFEKGLEDFEKRRQELRDEEKSLKMRREVAKEHRLYKQEFADWKGEVLLQLQESQVSSNLYRKVSTYRSNSRKIEQLMGKTGYFYTDNGYYLLVILGFVFKVITFLGLLGTVGFGVVNGFNIMFGMKYRDLE